MSTQGNWPDRNDKLPSCYGKEWDKNSPECAGGADANFVNPNTGSNVRVQCDFFQSCGTRVQARLIPPQQLVRPPVVTPPPAGPANFADWLQKQSAMTVEAQRQAALAAPRPLASTLAAQQQAAYHSVPLHLLPGAQHHPAPMYQLNYQMPGYLSVPEERQPGERLRAVLLREVLRSVFKALGHALAHFFDTRQLKEK